MLTSFFGTFNAAPLQSLNSVSWTVQLRQMTLQFGQSGLKWINFKRAIFGAKTDRTGANFSLFVRFGGRSRIGASFAGTALRLSARVRVCDCGSVRVCLKLVDLLSKHSEVILKRSCIFFLCFCVALQQFDKLSNIGNLFIMICHLCSQLFRLVRKTEWCETSLCHSFKLHFQEGHVGLSIGIILHACWYLEVLKFWDVASTHRPCCKVVRSVVICISRIWRWSPAFLALSTADCRNFTRTVTSHGRDWNLENRGEKEEMG